MTPNDNPDQVGQPATGSPSGAPPTGTAGGQPPATGRRGRRERGTNANMLPEREGRRFGIERAVVRLVATGGIIGIGVVLGAILTSQKVEGWIIGLVIAVVTVVLSWLLWSSRQL